MHESLKNHYVEKLVRVTKLKELWLVQPEDTYFGITIHEFGGEEVVARIPKTAAITAIDEIIADLNKSLQEYNDQIVVNEFQSR